MHYFNISSGTTELIVTFPMKTEVVTRNQTVGIYHGPLLYAADIAYSQTSHRPLNWTDRLPLDDSQILPQTMDYVLEPTSPWQFAIDPDTISVEVGDTGSPIFGRNGPPLALYVDAYTIDWPITLDTAALPPINPLVDPATKIRLKLIPFGAAKLHIAQFPVATIPS